MTGHKMAHHGNQWETGTDSLTETGPSGPVIFLSQPSHLLAVGSALAFCDSRRRVARLGVLCKVAKLRIT